MDDQTYTDWLYRFAKDAYLSGIRELIRLLESEDYAALTTGQILQIGNYHEIEINGTVYFDKPFSSGKAAQGILTLVRLCGRKDYVQEELTKLSDHWSEEA